ncbi:biotin--[acetyl-CoA-carboxylase] ligase [Erythrobacter sanguineus]|uniref:biotin--[biotin carboxyl-carrier protein] ligase n=1 Tax=Erythrobacter sanguineus TaxID=198312 RepID=A0A1M7S5S5_9SPHN|nr:biotin--[acetyl-CoA-carboxylase] ligase [Erythrobacter sanguineus]SHN53754.1 BirA family transcriptional regulator, biotin operon repressor / biotin-[acetyl-CoA-carboxylase] ligase [Erythrobacter sanguineus]
MNAAPAIRLVEETGSTNADLAGAIRGGQTLAEGTWLVARRQTAGRGRQGRAWFDGAGNFMGSTVVTLETDGPPPASLSFVAALAVRDAARKALGKGADLALKWPNDVLLNGGKLSGILLEMVRGQIVVGIGANLGRAPDLPDRKTAALADVIAPPRPEDFAASLAASFARRLESWRIHGLGATLQAFLDGSIHAQGSPVTVHDADGSVLSGSFAGLEESDGALRLRLADGSERVIRAGDIS